MKQSRRIEIDVPPADGQSPFRVGAAAPVLRQLTDAPDEEFRLAELAETVGVSRSTAWRGVQLLERLGAVTTRETARQTRVSVDTARLSTTDPVSELPQPEFHEPVRAFRTDLTATVADHPELQTLVGVVVFGSVARGEADRRSDVDTLVVVDGDRTTARRVVSSVADELAERRFQRPGRRAVPAGGTDPPGDRYDFDTYVETPSSLRRAGPKLGDIAEAGIVVDGGDRAVRLLREVYPDE